MYHQYDQIVIRSSIRVSASSLTGSSASSLADFSLHDKLTFSLFSVDMCFHFKFNRFFSLWYFRQFFTQMVRVYFRQFFTQMLDRISVSSILLVFAYYICIITDSRSDRLMSERVPRYRVPGSKIAPDWSLSNRLIIFDLFRPQLIEYFFVCIPS
jgi:hypothetical protein